MLNISTDAHQRLSVLDGWRGISILLVLAAHLLPLGPKDWRLNEAAGAAGMALFFTLSGFLITRLLLENSNVPAFLTRRFLRIVPLAWVAMTLALLTADRSFEVYLSHFLFFANIPPITLTLDGTAHLWSLCVEMQFYVGVALLVGLFGRKALFALPLLCLAVTGYRIWYGAYIDIVTWRRLDEILAGCTLALIYFNHLGTQSKIAISKLSVLLLLVLLAIASSPLAGPINYLRPYIAALLVGTSLLSPFPRFGSILKSRFLSYIAAVSYALYVIHGVMVHTWFGDGDKIEKYLKRPVLLAVTFALAHFSTFYFESKFIRLGKKISRRFPVNS